MEPYLGNMEHMRNPNVTNSYDTDFARKLVLLVEKSFT